MTHYQLDYYREACGAISAVSAVLWTGGLIILQLRSTGPRAPQDAQDYDRGLRGIKAAMACIAFSMLAPVFILFVTGPADRVGAVIFFTLYAFLTWRHVIRIFEYISRDFRESLISVLLLLPTLMLLLLVIWPSMRAVVWQASILLFFGFFTLSGSVYSFEPPSERTDLN
jgi:hypothetical protein